ncbi:cyanophycinase [Thalassotalea agarivorans]|uniref:Cyanophycinase n=1 Tax=Thalassotalea agarivorans TaxID=349064 RepID=A0A1H9YH72_THASX|nr:cyanophycinase [Thalassotalea agarivorans]SES68315.1 cyanophycinase [Thalassotalea agarivorans]
MLLKSAILSILLLISCLSWGKNVNQDAKLFLVGGGLNTCSSMSLKHCQRSDFVVADSKKSPLYRLSNENIALLFSHWSPDHLPQQRRDLERLLKRIARKNRKNLSYTQLRELWLDNNGRKTVNALADKEFYLMLDALEVGLFLEDGTRMKEVVQLSLSKNEFSQEIFYEFVSLAKQKAKQKQREKPVVLVVTASARDPYEAVDFYTSVFEQAGATTQWLPIDKALNTLWQNSGQCQQLAQFQASALNTLKRAQIYPDHFMQQQKMCANQQAFVELIQDADGLFINGGDQSLTAATFKNNDGKDNAVLKAIRTQMNSNKLIVGGTSAGTAVMSGNEALSLPMITNGRSENALVRGAKANVLPSAGCQKANACKNDVLNDDLTYKSSGGIGLFQWGIMDTHFSERGRQGRLVRLVQDTAVPFAFGVDEATALVVSWQEDSPISMNIVGQAGVFVVEGKQNNNVSVHYLTRGDSMFLNESTLSAQFADWKKTPKVTTKPLSVDSDVFADDKFVKAVAAFCQNASKKMQLTSQYLDSDILVTLTKTDDWRSGQGRFSKFRPERIYCSYVGLDFSYAFTD